MIAAPTFSGVLSPVVTPFKDDLSVDRGRWVAHCRWLLSHDVGLAIFGTNSEANSLSVPEKIDMLASAREAGLPPKRLMPGVGACALPDAVSLAKAALDMGCGGVLALPPFYYKGVSDDGLVAFLSELVQRVGDERLRLYVYHIPQVAGIGIPLEVIERLLDAYPKTIAGVKDSGGDWEHTSAMIERFGPRGFEVFAGSEKILLQTMQAGGVGCISATANVNPGKIAALARDWHSDGAEALQLELTADRAVFERYPMIAALKSAIGSYSDDAAWGVVRPPLEALDREQLNGLRAALDARGFKMPDLP